MLGIFTYRYMQAQFNFRPLLYTDYDQVLALWRRCDGVEVAEGDDRESFARYLDRNPNLSWSASLGEKVVAAGLCGHDGRRGLIYHLAVAPEFRGKGLAKKILQNGIEGLRNAGITRAIILVARNNPRGQEFWLSRGFEEISGALSLGLDLL